MVGQRKRGFKLLRAVRNPICSHEQIISIAYAELRTTYTNKNNSFLLLWNPCSTPTKYYYVLVVLLSSQFYRTYTVVYGGHCLLFLVCTENLYRVCTLYARCLKVISHYVNNNITIYSCEWIMFRFLMFMTVETTSARKDQSIIILACGGLFEPNAPPQ